MIDTEGKKATKPQPSSFVVYVPGRDFTSCDSTSNLEDPEHRLYPVSVHTMNLWVGQSLMTTIVGWVGGRYHWVALGIR